MPPMTKDRGKCWLSSPTKLSSTTHHAEGNIMTIPTQTVVGKGISNLLIAEGLLNILKEHLFLPKPLPIPFHGMVV